MASSPTGRSPWQRLHPERPTALVGAVLLTAIIAGAVAVAPVVLAPRAGTHVGLVGNGGTSGPLTEPPGNPPESAARDDSAFAATPTRRTGLAFLTLDDPLERAVSTLGPPDRQAPDINATLTHTWELAPGAQLDVTADDRGITGLAARVPADPPVRVAGHAGIVIGESTPAEITDRWAGDYDVARHPDEDFVLRYIDCAGPFPVVIKFDQDTGGPEVQWDEPVTWVLIAYADAEPGTAGCPAP